MPTLTLEISPELQAEKIDTFKRYSSFEEFMADPENEISDEEYEEIENALDELSEDDLQIVKREIIYI